MSPMRIAQPPPPSKSIPALTFLVYPMDGHICFYLFELYVYRWLKELITNETKYTHMHPYNYSAYP